MCVQGCYEVVAANLSRRGFFRAAGGAMATAAAAATLPSGALGQTRSFSKVVDLTHTLVPEFPTYFGSPQLEIEALMTFEKKGLNLYKWHIVEHTGTHIDTPFHFSANGATVDKLDPAMLVVPLVVIDLKNKAAADPDTRLMPADIEAFEQANGKLPENCCVAMNSGWAKHVRSEKFRNAGADGTMHFPGFHPDATNMLLERKVAGIAVDTLSLDYGASKDFKVHTTWLPAGRWGIECIANLDAAPATGATLVVGAPKVAAATGGPSRLFALLS